MTALSLPPVALVDAERLGFAVAASAERRLAGPVQEPLQVELVDETGLPVAAVPAPDAEAANAIAAAVRTAGWNTHTGGAR